MHIYILEVFEAGHINHAGDWLGMSILSEALGHNAPWYMIPASPVHHRWQSLSHSKSAFTAASWIILTKAASLPIVVPENHRGLK